MISVRRYASSLRHSEADLSISYCFISWPCEYPGLSFQRSPVCACSLVSSLLLSGATMSQQPSLTQSAHSVRQVLTAYTQGKQRETKNGTPEVEVMTNATLISPMHPRKEVNRD